MARQVEIKRVELKDADGGKRILVSFKFGFWMLWKRPTVYVYATVTRPDGSVTRRHSHNYWPPWRPGYIGSAFRFKQKGTWTITLDVKAKRAIGTEGKFIFECG